MKAIEEDNGYDKLILYPPPLNFFILPIICVSFSRRLTKKVSKCISIVSFWFENVFLIIGFFFYLFIHNPLIIVKIYFQIITKIRGFGAKSINFLLWTFLGIFYLTIVNVIDTCMLVNILCLENSFVFDQSEDEKNKFQKHKYYIYRDVIRGI